jgi:hypothetical protein
VRPRVNPMGYAGKCVNTFPPISPVMLTKTTKGFEGSIKPRAVDGGKPRQATNAVTRNHVGRV